MISVIYLAVATDVLSVMVRALIYIFCLLQIFSLKLNLTITGSVLVLVWEGLVLCSLSILVFSSSLSILVCFSMSIMASVRFSIFSFFSFFTHPSMHPSHLFFFPKSLLSLRQLVYLLNILYALQSCWHFFFNVSISSFLLFHLLVEVCLSKLWRYCGFGYL